MAARHRNAPRGFALPVNGEQTNRQVWPPANQIPL